ncbi:hypothetical protein DL96DRAFT_121815 [Flagelloscypha sp. PMI_526]|nr:hypothetical protein DL96DRAFT_121815 [Flagelloscypha sp. PMI_526]
MSVLEFHLFLSLPAEIQGKIFHFASSAATICEKVGLLCVSKATRQWVEDILYDSIFLTKFRHLASFTLLIRNHPGLLAHKTKSLYLIASDSPTGDTKAALEVLRELQNLRAAHVFISHREQDVLDRLGHLPQLHTLMLDSNFNSIAPAYLKTMTSYPFTATLTHLAMASWNDGPHAYFLACFPCLTHFSVTCYESPDPNWIDIWSSNLPPSVRVFAILDQWSSISRGARIPKNYRCESPVVLVEIPRGWSVAGIWDHLSQMWLCAEKLIATYPGVAEEGNNMIEMCNWWN